MMHRFIEHLANEEEFIFVDKVVAHQKVDINNYYCEYISKPSFHRLEYTTSEKFNEYTYPESQRVKNQKIERRFLFG